MARVMAVLMAKVRVILGRPELVLGTIGVAGALFLYFYMEATFPQREQAFIEGMPDEALFPILGICVMGLGGLLLIVQALVRKDGESWPVTGVKARARVAGGMVLAVAYVPVMEHTDFFVMTPLLMLGMIWLMGEREWKTLVWVPLAFDLFAYVVFFRIFGVMLPTILV